MKKEIAGFTVNVSDDGYLTDPEQWNREIAAALALEEGIGPLQEEHWKIIEYLRQSYAGGTSLSIRRIGKSGVITIQDFYQLFPGGPLKKASRIAGIPKPASCV